MPTDPPLADLAAAAERDAAAGVKPVLEWTHQAHRHDDLMGEIDECWFALDGLLCVTDDGNHITLLMGRALHFFDCPCDPLGEHGTEETQAVVTAQFTLAMRLLAESLLRRATLALHPPEPHVAAAVELARVVLNAWNEDGPIMGTHKWARTSGALHRLGLTEECRTGSRVSALGRALLNCGSPVEPATRDAKENPNAP